MTLYGAASPRWVGLFIAATGQLLPRPLYESVVTQWCRCEGQDAGNASPNNPLNIMAHGTPGQSGVTPNGVGGTYATPEIGAHWTAWLLANGPYQGIRDVLAKDAGPLALAQAIEASPWAASHYGSGPGHSGCIASAFPVTPPPAPQPWVPVDRLPVSVPGGTILSALVAGDRYSITPPGRDTVFSAVATDRQGGYIVDDGGVLVIAKVKA